MVTAGTKLDLDFTVTAIKDGEQQEVSFQDLIDRPTVVSVYMKNNTPGCNRQNKSLADYSAYFDKLGYNIVAISKDGPVSHQRYADKLDINYTLVSDPEYKFAGVTDSIVEKNMFGKKFKAPSRSAFVIDTDGTVLGVFEKVKLTGHGDQLKSFLETL